MISFGAASAMLGGDGGAARDEGAGAAADMGGSDDLTRVGRWMSQNEFDQMSNTGRVVEGVGGRTYVVNPPDPAAYSSSAKGSVDAEFDVPSTSLSSAGRPGWGVIPGPNVTTRIYGPPPVETLPATCIVWVCSK